VLCYIINHAVVLTVCSALLMFIVLLLLLILWLRTTCGY